MKDIIFFDVDTQYDFMHKDGKLYVPGAESIIPNLKKITQLAKRKNVRVIASADRHRMGDWEISSKTFPPHCMEGTKGQKKISETSLKNYASVPNKKLSKKEAEKLKGKNIVIIEKQEYTAFSNPNLKKILSGAKKAYVYGVATDYCVKAAVIGLRQMKIKTYVIKDAIKPVFRKNEKKDLALFRQKGAKFLTTGQLLRRKVL
ncbi:cysteine hydrolase family protein [Candidatus Woesearchaeota archaeon]|nr:cysteine hydrolase family protein [Candidatus Woesearchaeota archaeon]